MLLLAEGVNGSAGPLSLSLPPCPPRIFGTPFDPKAAWTVDACLLPTPHSSGGTAISSSSSSGGGGAPSGSAAGPSSGTTGGSSGGGSGGSGGHACLFLDIIRQEQAWEGNLADQERFVRWGYRWVGRWAEALGGSRQHEKGRWGVGCVLTQASCHPPCSCPTLPPSPPTTTTHPPTHRRFEALCTGQDVADASSEFGVLVRTRVAQHRIYLGAELDCYDPCRARASPAPASGGSGSGSGGLGGLPQQQQQAPPPLASCVELKTYRLPSHPGQQRSLYRFKHPKWWLQSFLAGVERLALGGRDDQVGWWVGGWWCALGGAGERLQSFLAGRQPLAPVARCNLMAPATKARLRHSHRQPQACAPAIPPRCSLLPRAPYTGSTWWLPPTYRGCRLSMALPGTPARLYSSAPRL